MYAAFVLLCKSCQGAEVTSESGTRSLAEKPKRKHQALASARTAISKTWKTWKMRLSPCRTGSAGSKRAVVPGLHVTLHRNVRYDTYDSVTSFHCGGALRSDMENLVCVCVCAHVSA